MPKSKSSSSNRRFRRPNRSKNSSNTNRYLCRICKRHHPLRTCRKFLKMSISDRIRAVRTHKYCKNCLAHEHSQGSCFSKYGCRHCKKQHHTLLHINPNVRKAIAPSLTPSRSPTPQPSTSKAIRTKPSEQPSSSITTLSSLLRQNRIMLLPTALVKLDKHTSYVRCLLDSASPISRISKKLVSKFNLTTLTMQDETMCPIVIKSRFDSNSKIEGIFRVDNRITINTPSQSLSEDYKQHFRHLFLADPKFYETYGIDIILGVDVYPKVIREGVFTKTGLPTAQSTMFGWIIYGPCETS